MLCGRRPDFFCFFEKSACKYYRYAVVADTINEALFDVFGDNVLDCDGDVLLAVEDYQEEILQMLGGNKDE